MNKIQIIQLSLRAFRLGLVSLLPLIGLPFGALALHSAHRCRTIQAAEWNPAARYLNWGIGLACFGLVISVLSILAIVAACT